MNLNLKILAGLLALGCAASLYLGGYRKGEAFVRAEDAKALARAGGRQAAVSVKVVTKYIPRIQQIQGKTITLVKKVSVYVTKKADSQCIIPTSFVSLWNAANSMQVPASAGSVDDSPSKVVLSEVAAQHITEVGIDYQNVAQVEALQEWIREQQKVTH